MDAAWVDPLLWGLGGIAAAVLLAVLAGIRWRRSDDAAEVNDNGLD